jgi:enoyl-CoA hydratase/carnithine racemase
MKFEEITYDHHDGIATITLDRPDQLNALTELTIDELLSALDAADVDDAVRVVVVTGRGRAFCAGADLSAGARTFDHGSPDEPARRDGAGRVALRIFDCRKPVIAAINGAAVGGGLTMTLPMDIRLVARGAKLGFVFTRRGIVPEGCSSWFLPRLVGIAQAQEWVLTGRIFDADEALARGLVQGVHEAEDLLDEAYRVAGEIARHTAAVSVAMARQMLWKMLGAEHPMEAHKVESRGMHALGSSTDAHEGVAAFLDKRDARFTMSAARDMPDFYPWWSEREYE